jgi:hypothetical protein
MPFRFHINCYTSATTEPWGHHDIEFTTHPTWKDVFDSYKYYGHYMINAIFSKVADTPKLDDMIIPNIEFKMRQNGYVGWSFMLFNS